MSVAKQQRNHECGGLSLEQRAESNGLFKARFYFILQSFDIHVTDHSSVIANNCKFTVGLQKNP